MIIAKIRSSMGLPMTQMRRPYLRGVVFKEFGFCFIVLEEPIQNLPLLFVADIPHHFEISARFLPKHFCCVVKSHVEMVGHFPF
jgi:hypothetical protein